MPLLPCLLLLFLCVHAPSSHAIPPPLPATYDCSICAESLMCGNVSISYPFYLPNATRETSDYGYGYSCGYTDLLISCQGDGPTETPVINLGGDNYAVQSIFYDNHTIILADINALVGGSSCPTPAVSHEHDFNEIWLHNSRSSDNLTFYFGCGSVPKQFDAYKIKCAGFKSPPDAGAGDSFVLTTTNEHDRYLMQELAANCSKDVTVL